ncbi:MAG: insulinase family protein, partial [Gammaproteobacteria bacterium]|nr:insulinase family protein [Gammaproteobacteria bacterium]
MGFKTPVVASAEVAWEPYALDMLVAVLDGGSSARFSRNLVRGKEIALSAGADYSAFSRLSGMLLLDGTPAKGQSMASLERAILDETYRLKSELVDEKELARVRAQLVADQVYELDSVFYQAMQIGTLETVGLNWSLLDEYVENLKKVTPEQVRAVAKKYLVEDHLTVTVLEPQPIENNASSKKASGGRHAG